MQRARCCRFRGRSSAGCIRSPRPNKRAVTRNFSAISKPGSREITGFAAVSLQPNAGSQGEYAGLLVIRAFHESRGEGQRNVCLIPTSAHGTNPASAAMCGFKVVPVACDTNGNIDVADLNAKAGAHAQRSRRVDGDVSFDPRRVRERASRTSAPSSTRTADRFTWTAPT